jgi:hypothetical protein
MEEIRLEMQLTREAHRENMARYEMLAAEMREFMREILLRVEKGGQRQLRALDELTDEIRAQREGLLRVLDRLQNGPGGASATA